MSEHGMFIILNFIFQDSLLFFLSRNLDGKGIVSYLLPKPF